MTDEKLANIQDRSEKDLSKLPKSDEFKGDRTYMVGRINALIEVRRLLRDEAGR